MSIHQPAYLPWLGYFDRIANSDLFILLDSVQFERNSFTNRNRIKTATGPIWLTIPVRLSGHLSKTINDIEIDEAQPWRQQHLRSIEQNYRKGPAFTEKFARLAATYVPEVNRLTDLCLRQLKFWLDELAIGTPVVRASELPITDHKSDLVLALCRHFGATRYLSGPLGRDYLKEEKFTEAGIEVYYHCYCHPEYQQCYGSFLPGMGIVDYWLNCQNPELFRTRR